jgi:chaperone modulatory protein CbpM
MSNTLVIDMQEFCQVVDLPAAFVIEIVEHGILEPQGRQPDELQLEWDGVALALDLLEELEHVRAENRMLRQRLGRFLE